MPETVDQSSKALSLNKEEIRKVCKGAAIAATGAFALFVLSWLGALDIQDPIAASFIAWLVPTATNAIKQYIKVDNPNLTK